MGLSGDKTGVYTEFAVEIREVLKGEGGNLTVGKLVHADRPGGYVRYPGGHERLYRFADLNMPAVGGEYLFFLTRPEQSRNYEVLTAYEFSPQGVTPSTLSFYSGCLREWREAPSWARCGSWFNPLTSTPHPAKGTTCVRTLTNNRPPRPSFK